MKTRSGNPFYARSARAFAAALALCAFLLLAFIPAGFMPSFAPDGKVAIVICSGMDSKTIYVDADQAPAGPSHERADAACPFMLAQASAAPSPVAIIAPSPVILSTPVLPSPGGIILSAADLALLPARGPPSVAIL